MHWEGLLNDVLKGKWKRASRKKKEMNEQRIAKRATRKMHPLSRRNVSVFSRMC